jgi:hypothetical protein
MAKRSEKSLEAQVAELESSARQARVRAEEVLRNAEKWLAARERGDEVGAASIERSDPALSRRLRAFENDVTLPADPQTFRRLREALLVMRLTDLLREAVDEVCPLCAELGISH